MNAVYEPASGLVGKLNRLAARTFARRPLKADISVPLVSFSFDDFPKSARENGARIIEHHGWRATFYTALGFAGQTNHLGELMDEADIRALHLRGHEIACHSFSHHDASRQVAKAFAADCERNCAELMELGIYKPASSFAFPYGEASVGAKRALAKRYGAMRGVYPGINRKGDDLNLLKAMPLDGGEAGLERALAGVREVQTRPGWLIFYGHDVREDPSQWGCTPAFLEAVSEAVAKAGIAVLPVGEVLSHLAPGKQPQLAKWAA
ncbi:MAG: polysaccharide deacetylase family protein [Oceanicaulis sp.]|uniref:polysaccharide deacetylase family protein n=1 Tax=Glycocaulis sp. TaxID=1969725 RepID=UPI0025C3AE2D|nr:polysaccharide deacetylase family protein [Glycocaulis sp.]MCC5980332.1 polysaccharide deacetylase family protein [Oceanicaulis sp.]MCH8521255.1 polysaccharide deacetylase family protein [Glycocaulis sp.]